MALRLDPDAAYAQNNLCYSWLMEANAAAAAAACGRALALEPGLVPARNNLALAMAMQGDLNGAAAIFGEAGGEGAAEYNLGIVYLSQRRYLAAAAAFDRAALLQPAPAMAGARARQARQRAAGAHDDEGGAHERR
jgi:tetratricopeptide (TPR) repeat protein